MTRLETIRTSFPAPIPCWGHAVSDRYSYCVGGALFRSVNPGDPENSFPGDTALGILLQRLNPQLTEREAQMAATAIVSANDDADFVLAWGLLATALGAYGQEDVDGAPTV